MAEPMRAILLRQSCWGAGQCSVQRPVMCAAGLRVRACGGGVRDQATPGLGQGAGVVLTVLQLPVRG